MSEYSESYHIRTDEPDATAQKLIDAGIAGFLFTPKNGWLTFVPSDADDKLVGGVLTDSLIEASGKPVLNYVSQEDFGWCFEYKRPEALSSEPYRSKSLYEFECWWDPEQNPDEDDPDFEPFDHAAFCRELGRPDLEAALTKIVQIVDPSEIDPDDYPDGFGPAWEFGNALGLPVYEYLSPFYVLGGPENFAEHGLREIGTRPPASAPAAGKTGAATPSAKRTDNIIDILKRLLGWWK